MYTQVLWLPAFAILNNVSKYYVIVACDCRRTNPAGSKVDSLTAAPQSDLVDLDLGADVLRERYRAYSVEPGEENLIVLRDLKKEFSPQDGNPSKVAVTNMSLSIARGECFGCATHVFGASGR